MTGSFEKNPASERIAVGVQTVGRQTQQDVARPDRLAGEHALAFDRAHDEASQIVLAGAVYARHFGRFTADQSAAIVFAAASDTRHDVAADWRRPAYRPQSSRGKKAVLRLGPRCR